MHQPQWGPKCPRDHKAITICLSHNCPHLPFQCQTKQCPCSLGHARCKGMQWQAGSSYLSDWSKSIPKEGREFMSRVDKIFLHLKERLERQEKLFASYCKDIFLGKDYSKLMQFLNKKDQKGITSQLLSSALKNLIEPNKPRQFSQFTTSEMQAIQRAADQLFGSLDKLYHSKQQQPKVQVDKLQRCSSAVLTRSKSNTAQQNPDSSTVARNNVSFANEVINLKLDLTFPRAINSKIVNESTTLNRLMSRKIRKYHLAYRASENHFSVPQFYSKMGTTHRELKEKAFRSNQHLQCMFLIMAKTQFGKVLGGFTPLQWEQSREEEDSEEDEPNPETHRSKGKKTNKYKADPSARTAFFSVDLMEKYQLKKANEAIYCGRHSIGFGKGDLRILDKGDLLRKNCCKFPSSYNYSRQAYTSWSKSGQQLSGGRYSCFFKLSEWQAFVVEL